MPARLAWVALEGGLDVGQGPGQLVEAPMLLGQGRLAPLDLPHEGVQPLACGLHPARPRGGRDQARCEDEAGHGESRAPARVGSGGRAWVAVHRPVIGAYREPLKPAARGTLRGEGEPGAGREAGG